MYIPMGERPQGPQNAPLQTTTVYKHVQARPPP